MYTITIEILEMNYIKISSNFNKTVYYDTKVWTLEKAVENYVKGEE